MLKNRIGRMGFLGIQILTLVFLPLSFMGFFIAGTAGLNADVGEEMIFVFLGSVGVCLMSIYYNVKSVLDRTNDIGFYPLIGLFVYIVPIGFFFWIFLLFCPKDYGRN